MIKEKRGDSEAITHSINDMILLKSWNAMNGDTAAVVGWKYVKTNQ